MKILITLVVVLLAAGGIYFAKSRKDQVAALPPPSTKTTAVETVRPREMKVEQTRRYLGVYSSVEHPVIASKISGFVRRVHVAEGERVKRGDLLIEIDATEVEATVAAQRASIEALRSALASLELTVASLESDYRYAKEVYGRNRALFKAGALAKEKLDQSEVAMRLKRAKLDATLENIEAKRAEIAAAKAQLRAKESLLPYATLRAPIDGTVLSIALRTGDLAAPGKPILRLAGDRKRVDFTLSPDDRNIRAGTPVRIEGVRTEVARILPAAERSLAVARVEPLPDLGVAENASVTVTAVTAVAEGTGVPVDALLDDGDKQYLFLYEGGRFRPKEVTVLANDGKYAVLKETVRQRVARGSDEKLSRLFVLEHVEAVGDE